MTLFLLPLLVAVAGIGSPSWLLLRVVASAPTVMPVLANDLPDPTPKEFMIWLACALLIVTILGAIFWTWNQGKEALGRKPAVDDELEAIKKGMVTQEDLDTQLDALANEMERKFEKALHEELKQLNRERSSSIAGLHAKVEGTATELRGEIGIVNAMVREMSGEMKAFFRGGSHK